MTLNYAVWWFVKPSQSLAFIFAAGFLFWIFGRRQAARWFLGIGGGGLLLAGFAPLGLLLIGPLESLYPMPKDPGRVDGVIVLGGSELPTLSALYGAPQFNADGGRLLTTLLLAGKYPQARIVHTGSSRKVEVDGAVPTSESEVAAALLLGSGIAPERLTFENQSHNTCDNAALSKQRVNPGADERWLLVTSAFHMPRAMACFRASDWAVIPYPTDFKRSPNLKPSPSLFSFAGNLAALDLAAHEWIGLAYYRLRGLID